MMQGWKRVASGCIIKLGTTKRYGFINDTRNIAISSNIGGKHGLGIASEAVDGGSNCTNSTREYRRIMEEYLAGDNFQFHVDRHEASMKRLRQSMELVYLRDRPLVCIDVEAWEKSLKMVTEIGIVVYDPTELQGSIMPVLKPIHIVVRENLTKLNGKYVPDNKHRYIGGTSHLLTFGESKNVVDKIINKYIVEKNGVLVGHNVEGDIKWIRGIGVKLPELVVTMDTLKLYGISRSTGGTLRGVLRLVDIPHAILHNAANDAYYTLLAAMAYCDPVVRSQKHLDVYLEPDPKLKHEKKVEKFSDHAQMVGSDGILGKFGLQ